MEFDYSQQPGLEAINPDGPHQEHQPENPKIEPEHSYLPGWNAVATEKAKPERRLCGLRPVTFGLILALIVLVIAAAVGGGVGGSIAVKNAKDAARKEALASCAINSTSATSSSTSSSQASGTSTANTYTTTELAWGPVIKDPLPTTGCPESNNTIYTSTNGPQKWRIYCGFDMPGNDLIQTNTPSIQLCIETCANWNLLFTSGPACKGMSFVPSFILGGAPTPGPSDCYLKTNGSVDLLVDKSTDTVQYTSIIVQ